MDVVLFFLLCPPEAISLDDDLPVLIVLWGGGSFNSCHLLQLRSSQGLH